MKKKMLAIFAISFISAAYAEIVDMSPIAEQIWNKNKDFLVESVIKVYEEMEDCFYKEEKTLSVENI